MNCRTIGIQSICELLKVVAVLLLLVSFVVLVAQHIKADDGGGPIGGVEEDEEMVEPADAVTCKDTINSYCNCQFSPQDEAMIGKKCVGCLEGPVCRCWWTDGEYSPPVCSKPGGKQ